MTENLSSLAHTLAKKTLAESEMPARVWRLGDACLERMTGHRVSDVRAQVHRVALVVNGDPYRKDGDEYAKLDGDFVGHFEEWVKWSWFRNTKTMVFIPTNTEDEK